MSAFQLQHCRAVGSRYFKSKRCKSEPPCNAQMFEKRTQILELKLIIVGLKLIILGLKWLTFGLAKTHFGT
jgi:hypothetical protein